jgi:hypothetical protein
LFDQTTRALHQQVILLPYLLVVREDRQKQTVGLEVGFTVLQVGDSKRKDRVTYSIDRTIPFAEPGSLPVIRLFHCALKK